MALDPSRLPFAPVTDEGLDALWNIATARARLARDASDAEADSIKAIVLLGEVGDWQDLAWCLTRALWLRKRPR